MAWTYQDVVDLARIPLNDADKARYSDADLLVFANQAVLQAAKRRPDLFIGRYGTIPDRAVLADDVLLPAAYVQMLADYVTARAESVDDEHVNSGRAAAFWQLFGAEAPL